METQQDTGLIDADSVEFKNFVKFGIITYVILAIIGLTWEQIIKRIKNSKVKPYGKCDPLTNIEGGFLWRSEVNCLTPY